MPVMIPDKHPLIMGVVNTTPDSFSDGGRYQDPQAAVDHALALVAEGADVIDIGGESTRPGADIVDPDTECARVIPVIRALAERTQARISIDTRNAKTMRAAIAAGAHWINDVQALQGEGALAAAAELDVPICLMHMRGQPATMQQQPTYDDVVAEVHGFLLDRASQAEQAGIARERIILDPGFGFGKRLAHNVTLFRALPALVGHGYPVLVGVSRKRMLGEILDEPDPAGRVLGGAVAAALAVAAGARMIRTHDVAQTRQALQVQGALMGGQQL